MPLGYQKYHGKLQILSSSQMSLWLFLHCRFWPSLGAWLSTTISRKRPLTAPQRNHWQSWHGQHVPITPASKFYPILRVKGVGDWVLLMVTLSAEHRTSPPCNSPELMNGTMSLLMNLAVITALWLPSSTPFQSTYLYSPSSYFAIIL